MKQILLLFLLITQLGVAQQVKILSVEKIKETQNGGYFYPKLSPNADFILLTQINHKGLVKYAISESKLSTVTEDNGAGYDAQISQDGTSVLYKKIELINNLRYNSLISQNLTSNSKSTLIAATRENISGKYINSSPIYVKSGKILKNGVISQKVSQSIITIEDRKMIFYKNNTRIVLTPNGADKSYIWPSISPDGTHIVYTVSGKGTFVANINGNNAQSLGKLSAPKWIGNKYIIGMDDIDDGEKLISSTIKIVSIDGKTKQKLDTPQNVNAMYPSASSDGSKIVFNTDKGEIYLMKVELK